MQADAAVGAGAAAVPAPHGTQLVLGPCWERPALLQGQLGRAGAAVRAAAQLGLLLAQEELLDGVCIQAA